MLATGSIYLVADLLRPPGSAAPRCCDVDRRTERTALPADDRARGADRGGRDPRVLRDRLRASGGCSCRRRPVRPTGALAPPALDSPPDAPFAIFGIDSSGLNLAVNLLILFLVVIWLALVYWTYADARRRIEDPMLVGCATAASLFPFVGTIVYMIVRPPEYLDDVRERELEMQAAEARLAELGYHLCPHCDAEVEKDFLRCPSCLRKLKDPCASCAQAARPDVEDLPVLRGRGARPVDRLAAPPPAPPRREPPPRARPSRPRRLAARPVRRQPRPQPEPEGDTADGPDPHPGQAGRLRARPDRRDPRPLRAQGPAHRRAGAA